MNSGNIKHNIEKTIHLVDADKNNTQWKETMPGGFTANQRASTTVLFSGLTAIQDLFIQSAFRGVGFNMRALDVPDNDSLQAGREYGNRGQCNPTYFMVGNLVKHLLDIHSQGMSKDDIVQKYLFVNIGSCGPCRYGTYVTEYRKALRDAGFEGFRVILFDQTSGIDQASGEKPGFEFGAQFFANMTRAILAGDVLNALIYRIRPYEVEAGATDKAAEKCKRYIMESLENNRGYLKALRKSRAELASVKVDKSQGNYRLQRFLESEGAEVEVQPVAAWIQYLLWGARYDTTERAKLSGTDKAGEGGSRFSLEGVNVAKRLLLIKLAEKAIPLAFKFVARVMGLKHYKLADMDDVANVSHDYYDNNLRGGEGHMEVGKLILNVSKKKADMTVSVKPFGCMPSSGVSDGVQSIITEKYPEAIFIPIETTGDGAVNVYSRLQMQLFKAKQVVENEMEQILKQHNVTAQQYQNALTSHKKANSALNFSKHHAACSAINTAHEVIV